MQDFLQLCRLRSSVRQYSSDPIPEDVLNYIMECVRLAPSAVNKQPWHFRLCTLEEDLQKLRACYKSPWFETAKYCFLVCCQKSEEWVRRFDGKPHGDIDVAIAVEHLCLAAAEQGLGTCWVCAFDAAECKRLFELPDNLEPVALVPIGYPQEGIEMPEKVRKPMSEIFEG